MRSKREASTLHFDIEWFTKDEDTSVSEKLSLIKSEVAASAQN